MHTRMAQKKELPVLGLTEYKGTFHYAATDFQEIRDFKCREDDVWICSFPRSGTTLTQQTVYLVQTLNFGKASTILLEDRVPKLEPKVEEYPYFRGPKYVDAKPTDEPRMIKSHLHYFLLPEELKKGKGKIVYILRNPKSAILSFYKLDLFMKQMNGVSLREYIERFLSGKNILSCPWGLHVSQYWEHKDDGNILILQYENVIKDRPGTVRRIAEFLGKDLTDEDIEKIVDHTSIEKMKNNKAVNWDSLTEIFNVGENAGRFINTGEISGWKREIPEDLVKRLDEMIEREIGHTDIKFE